MAKNRVIKRAGGFSGVEIANTGRGYSRFQTAKRLSDRGQGLGHFGVQKHFSDALGTYAGVPDGGGYHNRKTVEDLLREIGPFLDQIDEQERRQAHDAEMARRQNVQNVFNADNSKVNSYQAHINKAQELRNYLNAERAKNDSLNYAPYTGPTSSGISDLTKRMRSLEDSMAQRAYTPEMDELSERHMDRDDQGLTGAHFGDIESYLENRHKRFYDEAEDRAKRMSYHDFTPQQLRAMKDVDDNERASALDNFRGNLKSWDETFGLANAQTNLEKLNLLHGMSDISHTNKKSLIDRLRVAGKEDTGLSDMKLAADKQNYENQQAVNVAAFNRLQEASNPVLNYGNVVESELNRARDHAIARRDALEAGHDIGEYGYSGLKAAPIPNLDINQLQQAYQNQKSNVPQFRVADKTQSLKDAQSHLMGTNFNPSRFLQYETNRLMKGRDEYGQEAIDRTIDNYAYRDRFENDLFQKELQGEVNLLADKYGRLAGSPAHMEHIRKLTAEKTAQRDKERRHGFLETLGRQGQLSKLRGDLDLAGTKMAALLDNSAQKRQLEQLDIAHKRGLEDWEKEQDEKDKEYRAGVDRQDYMWPVLKHAFAMSKYSTAPLSRLNTNLAR